VVNELIAKVRSESGKPAPQPPKKK